jgi:hypothetical protein
VAFEVWPEVLKTRYGAATAHAIDLLRGRLAVRNDGAYLSTDDLYRSDLVFAVSPGTGRG